VPSALDRQADYRRYRTPLISTMSASAVSRVIAGRLPSGDHERSPIDERHAGPLTDVCSLA